MRVTSIRTLHPAPDASAQAELTLEIAADEVIGDLRCQSDLNNAKDILRTGGTTVRYVADVRKDALQGGSTLLGAFIVAFGLLVSSVLTGTAAAWLSGRSGRKVRLKVGEIEVEARTVAEVEKLLEVAAKVKSDGNGKDG